MRFRTTPFASFLTAALLIAAHQTGQASHLLGAEIDLYHLSGTQYQLRLLLWRDCSGLPPMATEVVTYSSPCGTGSLTLGLVGAATTDVSPLCAAEMPNSSCAGGALPGLERLEYAVTLPLMPCDSWTFQWDACCLMAANNLGSVNIDLVTHTTLNNLDLQCRNAPRFAHPGLPFRSSNSPFTIDLLGLIDGPGTPQYALVNLLTPGGAIANYAPGYTGANPYPTMTVDASTGILGTGSTTSSGPWMIVEKLTHNLSGVPKASVERAFLMLTYNLGNSPPLATDGSLVGTSGSGVITGARTAEAQPGDTICATMSYADPDVSDSVFLSSDLAIAIPGASIAYNNGNAASADLCWVVPAGASGPHRFIVHASDERCPVDQEQYYLYTITVLPDSTDPCLSVAVSEVPPVSDMSLLAAYDPLQHAITWQLPTDDRATVDLYDATGRALLRTIGIGGRGLLPLPHNAGNGVYLLQVNGWVARVLVQR